MKTSYEIRAMKFAHVLAKLFKDCHYLSDYVDAIQKYNNNHIYKLKYNHGISRIVIMRADYVIKFDYDEETIFGNCRSEEEIYKQAVLDDMEYLLAKTTVFTLENHTGAIMPKISGVGNSSKAWSNYCTDEEYSWLWEHVCDLHEWNIGYRKGKICVIDYAAG